MATAESFQSGIARYTKNREIIKDVIRAHGNRLHQDDFDKEFKDRKFGMMDFSDDAFVFALTMNNLSHWIQLLQFMIGAEECCQEGKPPNLVYSVKET